MIKISIDEAAAFDMLAILALKPNKDNYNRLLSDITDALGVETVYKVLGSNSYSKLLLANKTVFEYVDLITTDNINFTAKDVHLANMNRFYAKSEIQKRFFDAKLTEEKV